VFFCDFLSLFSSSFALKFVNRTHIFNYAANLVVKHDNHEDGEEQTQKDREARNDPGACLNEQPAVVAHAIVAFKSYHSDSVDTAKEDVDEEQEEVLLVIIANAVVDPGTVMVHPRNTSFARRTVVRHWSLDRQALLAGS
jgi:hypothetical protein